MSLLEIIQPDNPVLRRQALRINDFGAPLQDLINDMYETMIKAEGVGLAGPQVAQSLRLILVRLPDDDDSQETYGEEAGKLYVVANPKISKRSPDTVSGVEGCLSLPGLLGDVERHQSIEVTGQDRNGSPMCLQASDWLARIFQHEIDHLDGKLFIDIATRVWRPEEEEENSIVEKEA
ncbi:MAG: peptide deformylase [Chloroflexota bacterium]|nr:peptide deformylase [Chloroflexota bacterium]MDE2858679.1 peptide deformylase [Chloroflexota bacterium]